MSVVEVSRLNHEAFDGPTWCVVLDSKTDDPASWLHGDSLWVVSPNDEGWQATPTAIIATMWDWAEVCGMPQLGAG